MARTAAAAIARDRLIGRPPLSRLETHITYWLRRVSNQVSLTLSRRLEHKGVTLAEWLALRELYDGVIHRHGSRAVPVDRFIPAED